MESKNPRSNKQGKGNNCSALRSVDGQSCAEISIMKKGRRGNDHFMKDSHLFQASTNSSSKKSVPEESKHIFCIYL